MSINPIPSRTWSRLQRPCTYIDPNLNTNNDSIVFNSYVNQTMTKYKSDKLNKMFYKGNILKYTKNACNLTKNQQYSRLARGVNSLNKKSYASQTDTYTNPNMLGLLRQNYTEIPYPSTIVESPDNCSNNIFRDGGNLVSCTYVNPCTNEIIQDVSNKSPLIYNSTSCSDVPGKPEQLCWSSTITPWDPKTQYTMPTSNDGFPTGYKKYYVALDASNLEVYLKTHYGNTNNINTSIDSATNMTDLFLYDPNTFSNTFSNNNSSITTPVPTKYMSVIDVNRTGVNNVTNTMIQNVQEQINDIKKNIGFVYNTFFRDM